MIWYRYPFWVFDMDGTLTESIHDFAEIKKDLGLPTGHGILESLSKMNKSQAEPLHRRLDDIEKALAAQARPAIGAVQLLTALTRAGAKLGILTRNTKVNALLTLEAAGLLDFFDPDDVLGRDEAKPKPDPQGLQHLLRGWEAKPEQAVMVGDFRFDIEAAKRAGMLAIYVDYSGAFPFGELADHRISRLDELLPFRVKLAD